MFEDVSKNFNDDEEEEEEDANDQLVFLVKNYYFHINQPMYLNYDNGG